MDDKKKPINGTYTQVPNVFFDTCNLPETAQILYLRLLRELGYKGGTFTGSIRELAKIVRYSKSTTDRLIKVLRDANLIMIEYDADGNMTIILNISDLWILNKYHYEVQASQIWDSKLPSVPEMGQACPENGTVRTSQKWDKSVPDLGQDQAQNQAPKEREEMKERMKERDDSSIHSSTPSFSLSSSSQKVNVTAYLRTFMRKFLLEMEVTGKLMDEELTYLQEVYYVSGLDKETFRFEAEKAIDMTRCTKGNIDYFYECLGRALHLEQVAN